MDIIINPTNACNFCCEFCSASDMPKGKLTIEDTIKLLEPYKNDLGEVIINGGDPLMMDPEYYFSLLEWIEYINEHSWISLTTNLLDFYKNPDKWKDLFRNKRIGVITSFQYGDKRRYKTSNGFKVFDEYLLRKIEDKFYEYIGYHVGFIYVVDKDNDSWLYIKHACELAKELDTRVRLNKVCISGKSNEYYPLYKLYEKYIKIIEAGYAEYEMNIEQLYDFFKYNKFSCNLSPQCCENITAINPDKSITTCSFTAGDINKLGRKDYDIKENPINRYTLQSRYSYIKPNCLSCDNYFLCNRCHIMIKEVRDNHDEKIYCEQMKTITPKLKELVLKVGDEINGRE